MKRIQEEQLIAQVSQNQLLLVTGPRNAGKEELILDTISQINNTTLVLELGDKKIRKEVNRLEVEELIQELNAYAIVTILEGQHLMHLEALIEHLLSGELKARLIVSCSFEPPLNEALMEALRMQGLVMKIFPPTFYELASEHGLPEEEKLLEQRLVYGNYPSVIDNLENAQQELEELLDDVIRTDLGINDRINKKDRLIHMLQVIAFSIGGPVSYNEIGEKCLLDNETVERYVDLLQKADILISLPTLFSDKRYELKKSHTIYFTDTGIRNMLIQNFNSPDWRHDMEQLWKNWVIVERIKWNATLGKEASYQFWRTHTRQTIDFIETSNGETRGYKTQWVKKKKLKFPSMFETYYPAIKCSPLNRSTYWTFLTKKK